MTDTFCPFPFMQLALKQWDNKNGILDATPCCNQINERFDPMEWGPILRTSDLSVEEIFNHDKMKELRSALLNGEKHKSCNVCWRMEETTGESYRKYAIDAVEKMGLEINFENPSLQIVDLSTGDNCNLRCRMCNPGVSNVLRKDIQKFKENNIDPTEFVNWDIKLYDYKDSDKQELHAPDVNHTQFLSLIDNLKNIKVIKAAGGEPFISKSFLYLLDRAIELDYAKNITLEITTNATKFNNVVLSKLNKFKTVKPTLSIDGTDAIYNYIRYPFDFNKLQESIENFISKSTNCSKINSNFVLQAYNYENIKNYIEWHKEITKKYSHKINLWTVEMDIVHPYNRPLDIKWLPYNLLEDNFHDIKNLRGDLSTNLYVNSDKILGYVENILENYQKDNSERALKQKLLKKEIISFDKNRNQCYTQFCSDKFINFLKGIDIDG